MLIPSDFIQQCLGIVEGAGEEIMKIYNTFPQSVEYKDDHSPLTSADLASNKYIVSALKSQFLYPIVSEETDAPYSMRKNYTSFWLVDPLDGTKDYLAHNNEFAINLALIENQKPVFGIIYLPALKVAYYATLGQGAYKITSNGLKQHLFVSKSDKLIVAKSRFHDSPLQAEFERINPIEQAVPFGSALKFCKLAEGEITVYARFIGSSEWDTAAGHIIVKSAGACIRDLSTGEEPLYNKQSLRNNFFIACAPGIDIDRLKFPTI